MGNDLHLRPEPLDPTVMPTGPVLLPIRQFGEPAVPVYGPVPSRVGQSGALSGAHPER